MIALDKLKDDLPFQLNETLQAFSMG